MPSDLRLSSESFDDRSVVVFISHGHPDHIFFLWRPLLPDPKDDMVVELAVAAGCQTIVTYNVRDFRSANSLGVSIQRPAEFLKSIGVLSWAR